MRRVRKVRLAAVGASLPVKGTFRCPKIIKRRISILSKEAKKLCTDEVKDFHFVTMIKIIQYNTSDSF
jgi:hypothetical protein